MKHIKLFEQFVNERDTKLYSAAGNGRYIARYKDTRGAYADWHDNRTIVTNPSEYSTEILVDAANALAEAGIQVKEKPIQDGILTVKFGGTTFSYQFKGGKWVVIINADGQTSEVPKNIEEFIRGLVSKKYLKFKDKKVGSK